MQSLNDTNTDADRAALQAEFDALQSEIDKITKTTQFNTQNIFDEHESPYYQNEGNVAWDQSQIHVISNGANDLVIKYRPQEADAQKTAAITVPAGEYTTQELMDEIEDALMAQGLDQEGIVVEYTDQGNCNINLEGGEILDSFGGGLSYLFYEMYEGGSFGALIGTTSFPNEYVELAISSENNTLEFDIEDFDGNVQNVSIRIPNGDYTRSEIIDYLNNELSGTDVSAMAYGTGIKLEGANSIVTGFKGNMFKIDGGAWHSVFYDNVKYGNISMQSAYFLGGEVRPTTADQEEFEKFKIVTGDNDQLTFKANGATTPVTITIPQDEYTIDEMVIKLNELFADNNLELSASIHPTYSSSYKGIRIDSTVKGVTSSVGVDSTSSAFNTLFKIRDYNSYGATAATGKDSNSNKNATVTGAKTFDGTNPLTIVAGQNDQFKLNVDGTAYTITLDEGTYNTATALADHINSKLSDANAQIGYKGKVTASGDTGVVILKGTDTSGIKNLSVSKEGNSEGYDNIFVKTTTTYSNTPISGNGSSSTKPTITLPGTLTDPMRFDDTNNKLDIKFNGQTTTVTFPTGTDLSHADIIKEIEDAFPETTSISPITFTTVEGKGTTTTSTVTMNGTGSTSMNEKVTSVPGSSTPVEGLVGQFANNKPAQVTIGKALPNSITLDDTNNKLQLSITTTDGTTTKMLQLDSGTNGKTYTKSQLVQEIQDKIDAAFGTGYGGAKVSLDSQGQLVFTSDLTGNGGIEKNAQGTKIACSASTSTFLKDLFTTETAATATSSKDLQSSITITDATKDFTFSYKENGVTKNVTLQLDSGTGTKTYTRNELVNEINAKLTAGGHNVVASLSGNKLQLKTKDTGNDTAISYSTTNGGSSKEALFGTLTTKTAATKLTDAQIQPSINIEQGVNDGFNVTVNGTTHNLILDDGDYDDRDEFVAMLNDVFTRNNVGLTATLENNKIRYTTVEKGSTASFKVSYANGGSAMETIYGKRQVVTPGIDASINPDGTLTLTGTQNGGSISVAPQSGSVFYAPIPSTQKTGPTTSAGYTSTIHAYIDGVNVSEPIKIDQYNNELKFDYYKDGAKVPVSITVPDGEYDFTDANGNPSIVDTLQSQLNAIVGANQLTVTASTSGIRIEAVNVGSKYYMTNFSGDFYKKVLCSCTQKQTTCGASTYNGTQSNDLAYTVGRKDIKNTRTEIKSGVNDTLSLDFTYGTTTKELTLTLDAGSYSGNDLIKEIQEKLDEQLVNEGLEAGTIQAQIGGVSTGVSGANDSSALVFKLSSTVRLPADGEYIIDGVSGNAAFSVFYQTDGELVPAYVKGGKDISEGVTILPGETDLSFKVDGTQYTLTLPEGEHTAQELLDKLNDQLTNGNVPLTAEMEDGFLKLSYIKIGKHTITDVDGLAKDEVFFSENGDKTEHKDVNIQLSSKEGDALVIEKPIVNTAFLKINSLAITKPKYANKALTRLDAALDRVLEIRSQFGSEQNRLGHAIANNENTYINTQAAETQIRDTDMANEMVEHSKYVILEQAAQAMQAHAKNITAGILQLLQ